MPWSWISRDDIRIIAIAGICKNAGKTSLLNAILGAKPDISFGVLSTGIDGEDLDTVFNIPKPKVQLPAGSLFCCDSATLDGHGSSVQVLASLGPDVSRPLWISRATVPISTRITGPATVTGQINISNQMLALGADKILVDGSLDRRSIALSDAVDAIAMVLGASFGTPANVIAETRRLLTLADIPVYHAEDDEYQMLLNAGTILAKTGSGWENTGIESLIGDSLANEQERISKDAPALYISGAITDRVWKARQRELRDLGAQIIIRHPDCLKLSLPELNDFLETLSPSTLIPFRLKAFAINTAGPLAGDMDAAQFRASIRESFPRLRFMDIMEINDAR
jgi:hypothetical protein